MEAVLRDVTATIPLDLWESHIDKLQHGKLVKVYIYYPDPKGNSLFLIRRMFCVPQYLSSPLKYMLGVRNQSNA